MKKKIPLQVLEIIEPYVNKKGTSFDSINSNDFLLKFIDKDESSDFYFNVESYKLDNNFQILIDWKPKNKQSIGNERTWIKAEHLNLHFTNWLKLLDGYENVKTVFDDPILEAFADEYFSEFEIVDEDANFKPFSTKQVLFLDSHLENIQKKIDIYITDDNKNEIEEIKNNIEELRNNLTKKSKKWVVKQLSKIWGKITIQGPRLMKEFLDEAKKSAIREGVRVIFEKVSELLN